MIIYHRAQRTRSLSCNAAQPKVGMEWMSNTDFNTLMQDRERARIRLSQLMEDMVEKPEAAKAQLYKYLQGHFVPCCYEVIPNFADVFTAAYRERQHCSSSIRIPPINRGALARLPSTTWSRGIVRFPRPLTASLFASSRLVQEQPQTHSLVPPSYSRFQGPNCFCGDYCVYFSVSARFRLKRPPPISHSIAPAFVARFPRMQPNLER